jgi:Na+/H+-dicarboxylate symporter
MSAKKQIPLSIQIVIGLVLGIVWSIVGAQFGWSKFTIDWIAPFGDIFIRLLKMIAVPLVMFSIIVGVASLSDIRKLGRLGGRTLITYLGTTVTAVTVGLLVVNIIGPGRFMDQTQRLENRMSYELWVQSDENTELPADGRWLMNDPANAEALAKARSAGDSATEDEWVSGKLNTAKSTKSAGPLQALVDVVPKNIIGAISSNSMLQIIFFSIFFGLMLVMIPGKKAGPVLALVDGLNDAFMKMVEVIMKAMPYFVFALMAGVMARIAGDDLGAVKEIFAGLTWYSLCVVLGLGIIVLLIYPALLSFFMRKQVFSKFLKAISPAQLVAFTTSSSVATLPMTMECVEDNIGVSKSTTSFVLPIGATVNMDGTSLYQAVAVVFLAQMHMVELDLMQQLTIVLTATLASIGAAAVPSAGLIMLIVVLGSVGLNPAWIAIILPVDRILDMCRTVVNVTGDATVSSIVAHSQGEKLFVEKETND